MSEPGKDVNILALLNSFQMGYDKRAIAHLKGVEQGRYVDVFARFWHPGKVSVIIKKVPQIKIPCALFKAVEGQGTI